MVYTPSGSYLELHFTLNEYEFKADEILQYAWDYAKQESHCRYGFTNEFFVFYHIAHIARHIYTGGCGLRPFIDFKIILDCFEFDKSALVDLLNKAELADFYNAATELTKMWFEGDNGSDICKELENYILNSGIYGNMENKIAVINEKNASRSKYIIDIIFPSKKSMAKKYPVIEKAPVLLPFMYVVRWISSLFRGTYKQILKVFSSSRKVTTDKQQKVAELFSNLGLK